MTEQMYNDLTPQGFIRRMFAETENGKVTIEYTDPDFGHMEKRFLQLNWSEEDVEQIVQRYNLLTSALRRIGSLYDQLQDEENRQKLLSKGDLEVYNTYVHPYEPMQINWNELGIDPPCDQEDLMLLIQGIHERGRCGDLFEEEEFIWKQYWMWNEEQSQKRIPFNRRSAADMITRASRYARLISLVAPEVVVTAEGRYLAEEMVLYYYGKEEPIIWD